MNNSISEKEKLFKMMTEIYNQLEELEYALELSFSELRDNWINEEHLKITTSVQNIETLEEKLESEQFYCNGKKDTISQNNSLKFELGY